MGPEFDVKHSLQDGVATLSLSGRFDFSQYAAFKEEQARVLNKDSVKEIVLDFGGLDYLDSAALGILLVLLDRAKEHGQPVTIRRAKGVVREILDVAHFERMFVIED
ncbi:STAS domain-containing protein [Marinobacter sp. CHS3-4]|uniref:STAS domain-containing protein n=1 Tax=Marinobacter sp. CHS3-4 TaxID=3045174 RepID=UPI0024B5A148|nr:STAS domain-containing protein [Marinobacter sp. CHS3-4]MDI9245628.1 STAS domain-containing protein [Marinobacter sp. CHS3-4]